MNEAFLLAGFKFSRFQNGFVAPFMTANECCWVRRDNCDCGTFVGIGESEPGNGRSADIDQVKRMRRKGWGEAKIQRALNDSQTAQRSIAINHTDNSDFFIKGIHNLLAKTSGGKIGLFWHDFQGQLNAKALQLKV